MSTLAHRDPVSQSVSIPVTDRHRSWPDEGRWWSAQPGAWMTPHPASTAQTVHRLRDERDHVPNLLVVGGPTPCAEAMTISARPRPPVLPVQTWPTRPCHGGPPAHPAGRQRFRRASGMTTGRSGRTSKTMSLRPAEPAC
jgi:hypothetical protein